MFKTLLLAFVLISSFGCRKPTKVESFTAVLGAYFKALAPEIDTTLAKESTVRGNGWVVFQITDGTSVAYIALDTTNFDPETVQTPEEFAAWVTAQTETVAQFVSVYETDDGTQVPGYYVDSDGYLYETTEVASKDLEKTQAISEIYKVKAVADKLATNYGFSVERSFEVAKFVSNFNKVARTRGLTKADYNAFSEELMGLDYEGLQNALNGDVEASNQLINSAASRNDVSPEAIRALIEETL